MVFSFIKGKGNNRKNQEEKALSSSTSGLRIAKRKRLLYQKSREKRTAVGVGRKKEKRVPQGKRDFAFKGGGKLRSEQKKKKKKPSTLGKRKKADKGHPFPRGGFRTRESEADSALREKRKK